MIQSDGVISSTRYGFPSESYESPWTVEEIAQANQFIEGRLEFYKVQQLMEVYLVPLPYENVLMFISIRRDYEPDRNLQKNISNEVEQFLKTKLRDRIQRQPNQSPTAQRP